MSSIPEITPQFRPQPSGVNWPTSEWPRGEGSVQSELEDVVQQLFENEAVGPTNAVVIIQGGKVLVERYGGVKEFFDRDPEPITKESGLLSWSMAKSMGHTLVGTLVDQGLLDPQQPAPVPEWQTPGDPRQKITLAQLLEMRDGLAFSEVYELGQTSHVVEMLFGEGKPDMAHYTASLPLGHEPGTFFNYSSGTSNVISRIVADQVGYGDSYRQYIDQRLFGPLGMKSAEVSFDDRGVFIASSFVHANALDFAKFGLLYLRGGEWDGARIISEEWAATAQIPHSFDAEGGLGHFYSWQWWVTGDKYGTYWASGYEGQMISVVPALDALILRFGHTPSDNYAELYDWRRSVLEVLAKND